MDKQYFVYFLGNYLNTTLYIGMTNNLCKRVWEHKQELVSGFTKKYHTNNLIYYELFVDPISAIEREKQIKRWSRRKKDVLIMNMNPDLVDLYPSLCL